MQNYDIMAIAEWYPNTMDYLQPEEGNCLSHAVCYDSVALMPLIQTNRVLFSDGDDTANRTGHDMDDDGSPAELFIRLFTTTFVLAVEFRRDDAMSGEDQWTSCRQFNLCDIG